MNFSRQRELIYNQVMNNPIHPTADEVYSALKKDNPNLSLGTVYRNLNMLSELGMLQKLSIADGSDRFDGRTDKHLHMVCDKCGKVFDIETDVLAGAEEKIHAEHGHIITKMTLNLNGVCADCAEKSN